MRLVKDNNTILAQIDTTQIDTFMAWLQKQKDPSFLDFLSVLCVCQNRALPKNQKYVFETLLLAHEKDQLLYLTRLNGSFLFFFFFFCFCFNQG